MMISVFLLMAVHVLGDFYIQSAEVATKKEKLNKYMIRHIVLYTSAFIICFAYFGVDLTFAFIIGISHLIIDIIAKEAKKKFKNEEYRILYIDQIVHVIVLWIVSSNIIYLTKYPSDKVNIVLALLLLFKPASILISVSLKAIFPEKDDKDELKIGRYIGYLERTIVFLLCYLNAIGSIGFIIAAKTLVRYKEINDNKEHFQEKYLIGTLLSTIVALCCYAITKLG